MRDIRTLPLMALIALLPWQSVALAQAPASPQIRVSTQAPATPTPFMPAQARSAAAGQMPEESPAYARAMGKLMALNPMPFADDDVTDNNGIPVNRDVGDAIKDITEHVGIPANFLLISSNVQNALAYMYNGQRVLYYNIQFMRMAHDEIDPNWAVISILAHEVGHHLLGHIFIIDDKFKQRELEADQFSGFIMYRMGATLDEALLTMRTLGPDQETPSHPHKAARLAAIETGWRTAAAISVHEADLSRRRAAREAMGPSD